MRKYKTRDKRENHIEMVITGEKSKEIGREIRAALHRTKHRHSVSYEITIMDSLQ